MESGHGGRSNCARSNSSRDLSPRVFMKRHPADACSPSGELWWKLHVWPGRRQKFGAEPRLAAWLMFNAKMGDILTLKQLRDVLGDVSGPNVDEHFNRRFRELRKYGWRVLSSRDARELKPNEYQLERVGDPIWLGKARFGKHGVSDKPRREVFDRDGRRCVVCGIGAAEPYPDDPTRKARLTVGHVVAGSLEGLNDIANLRTECSRCNEPVREEIARSESALELWPQIRSLKRSEKLRLLSWIERGRRERDGDGCSQRSSLAKPMTRSPPYYKSWRDFTSR